MALGRAPCRPALLWERLWTSFYTAGLKTLDGYRPCGETPRWRTGGRCPSRSSGSPADTQTDVGRRVTVMNTESRIWSETEITEIAGASFTIQETVPVFGFLSFQVGIRMTAMLTDAEEAVPVLFGGHGLHFGANSRWLHTHLLVGALSVRMVTISCKSFRLSRGPDVTYLKLHCCLCFVSAHRLFYCL